MALTIRDGTIRYDGKVLPRDKAPIKDPPQDPNIVYNGSTFPADKVTPQPFSDAFNTPGQVTLISPTATVILPPDTKIWPHGEKHIVLTTPLDADGGNYTAFFERIRRKPYKIEIEGVFRMQNKGGVTYENTNPPSGLRGQVNNVFAQDYLNTVWNNAWIPDTVLRVKNSFLNGLGILEIVIESMSPDVVRGSKNIPFHISAWENTPGLSLTIP